MTAICRYRGVARWAATSLIVGALLSACSGGWTVRQGQPVVTATAPTANNPTPLPIATITVSAATPSPILTGAVHSVPGTIPWFASPGQQFAQSAAGTFALELGAVIGPTILLAYAMQTTVPGPPQVAVTVTDDACPGTIPRSLPSAKVYDFGRLGPDAVGIIAIPWQDQPGQVFTIDITPPGYPASVWHLAPLQQIAPSRIGGTIVGVAGDYRGLPEILVGMNGSPLLRGGQTGFVAQQDPPGAPRYIAHVFFLVDVQGQVTQVSEAQYVAAGGGTGGANGTVAPITLAPTYPPTPTIPGAPTHAPLGTSPRIACT